MPHHSLRRFSLLAPIGGPWLTPGCVVLAATLCLTGCGKKQSVAQTPPAAPTADAGAAPAPDQTTASGQAANPTPAPTVAASPDGGADLRDLNHIYIHWVIQNRRHARTFEEFVNASGVNVPPAPTGKKYIIDKAGFIALVNQ